MASPPRQIDGRIEIVTPENIAFEYRVAGPFWRLPAYLIDLAIRIALSIGLLLLLSLALGSVGLIDVGLGLTLVAWFVLSWFYGGLFETFWNGQTPGKRMMGLRVVSITGQPINASEAVLRNVLRAVDGMPGLVYEKLALPFYSVGLLTSATNNRFQRIGDLVCGTMVIIEDRHRLHEVARVNEPAVVDLAFSLPANFLVSPSLALALAKYVERRKFFAPARRAEIARHLGYVLVEKLELPPHTNHDLLLCALYNRAFITERSGSEPDGPDPARRAAAAAASSAVRFETDPIAEIVNPR